MFKKIFEIFRKIIVASLFIYAYNKLTLPLNFYIPINIFTVLLTAIFGLPAILMMILYSLICL